MLLLFYSQNTIRQNFNTFITLFTSHFFVDQTITLLLFIKSFFFYYNNNSFFFYLYSSSSNYCLGHIRIRILILSQTLNFLWTKISWFIWTSNFRSAFYCCYICFNFIWLLMFFMTLALYNAQYFFCCLAFLKLLWFFGGPIFCTW